MKENDRVEYRTHDGFLVVGVISQVYISVTGMECFSMRNGVTCVRHNGEFKEVRQNGRNKV